jgi:deazaflavin-dependent oxidoreductase (nitroreductase family)
LEDVMGSLPRWQPYANRAVKVANRLGAPLGTIQVLEVLGRRSGRPQATPVSTFAVDGREYVIAGLPEGDWARNVAAAGHGTLAHGRRSRPVRLVEIIDRATRRDVVRAFPERVPHGVPFFVRLGLVDGPDPDQFAHASDQVRVFEILDAD